MPGFNMAMHKQTTVDPLIAKAKVEQQQIEQARLIMAVHVETRNQLIVDIKMTDRKYWSAEKVAAAVGGISAMTVHKIWQADLPPEPPKP